MYTATLDSDSPEAGLVRASGLRQPCFPVIHVRSNVRAVAPARPDARACLLESAASEAPARERDAIRRRQTMKQPSADVTMLLRAASSGERGDLDALMTAIYDDLRRLAISHMKSERDDHTLQPTAVVHEAYVKLVDQRNTDWKDRLHFFAVASQIIRRLLVDHARERRAEKRGGGGAKIDLSDRDLIAPERGLDLIALDEALAELGELDEQQAKIVELRFFGGCSIEEVSELLKIGKRTVDRDWQAARAWLFVRLEGSGESGGAFDHER
jgi:RNA polymerase sigma-70 factor, ECF subfamily